VVVPGFFGRLFGGTPAKPKSPTSIREAIKLVSVIVTRSVLDMERTGDCLDNDRNQAIVLAKYERGKPDGILFSVTLYDSRIARTKRSRGRMPRKTHLPSRHAVGHRESDRAIGSIS
jgi:hypothetical protein